MAADLEGNWEVLGEPVQSAMRAASVAGVTGMENPYERLKELTRGQRVGQQQLIAFVDGLDISDAAKERLRRLTPSTYTGVASELVDRLP